ncbi:MAG: hypothetical protein R2837_10060 [Aliarcobacter sp.]
MPNCPNGHVLENIVGKFVPATVKGKLMNAGWSASMGYHELDLIWEMIQFMGICFIVIIY